MAQPFFDPYITNTASLNFIRLLRVVITPSVTSLLRGENDSKQSDEFQAKIQRLLVVAKTSPSNPDFYPYVVLKSIVINL